MPVNRYYSSTAVETTVTSPISAGAASVVVASIAGFPVSTPFTIIFEVGTSNEEISEVTAIAGTTFTINRGVDGSSALSHTSGAKVVHGVSARDFRESQEHIAASVGVHGLGGATSVVGHDTVQTLSNKTLSSPIINTPTVSNPTMSGGGSWAGSPTLTTPTIANLTNMPHNHSNAAGGGSALTAPTISNPTVTGGGSFGGNPTFSGQPSIADLTNLVHDHSATNKGGAIPQASITGLVTALSNLKVSVFSSSWVSSPTMSGGPFNVWNPFTAPQWPALTFTTPSFVVGAIIMIGAYVNNDNTATSTGAVSFATNVATGLAADPFFYALETRGTSTRSSQVRVVTGLATSTSYTFTPQWRFSSGGSGSQQVIDGQITVVLLSRN